MLLMALSLQTIHIGRVDAGERRFCVFDLQIFGTGTGLICDSGASEPVVVDTACRAFEPIIYTGREPEAVRRQIQAHNAAWDALCRVAK